VLSVAFSSINECNTQRSTLNTQRKKEKLPKVLVAAIAALGGNAASLIESWPGSVLATVPWVAILVLPDAGAEAPRPASSQRQQRRVFAEV